MAGGVPMARIDFFDLSVRYAVILAKSFWIEPICKVDPNSEDTQGSRVGHRVQTQKAMSPDAADRYSASKSEAQGPYGLGLSRPVCNSYLSRSRLSAFLRSFIFVTHGEPGDEESRGAQKKRGPGPSFSCRWLIVPCFSFPRWPPKRAPRVARQYPWLPRSRSHSA